VDAMTPTGFHPRGSGSLTPLNLDRYVLSGKWKSGKATEVLQHLAGDFTGWEKDNGKLEAQVENVIREAAG
jgi:hypothetical protein